MISGDLAVMAKWAVMFVKESMISILCDVCSFGVCCYTVLLRSFVVCCFILFYILSCLIVCKMKCSRLISSFVRLFTGFDGWERN